MKYSQNNEELIILDFFNKKVGRFLDLGANDGITLSNTHALTLRGWSGVCVEPSPSAYNRLVELYKDNNRIECIERAVGRDTGIVTLHESNEHLGKGDISLLSTTVPSEIGRWRGTQIFTPIQVKMVTVKQLFDSIDDTEFDFISIDCEGLDYEILIDLIAIGVKPAMICVEWNTSNFEKYESALSLNYRLHHKNYENLIFIRK